MQRHGKSQAESARTLILIWEFISLYKNSAGEELPEKHKNVFQTFQTQKYDIGI